MKSVFFIFTSITIVYGLKKTIAPKFLAKAGEYEYGYNLNLNIPIEKLAEYCRYHGWQPAAIPSQLYNDVVEKFLEKVVSSNAEAGIGLEYSNGQFRWLDGYTPFGFDNRNDKTTPPVRKLYTMYLNTGISSGRWNYLNPTYQIQIGICSRIR
ncbi:unnamed protein product [Bursaphelenchus xylophilus]|uniref:(pine wood nematode) hypothetical protein n=1 Tax=Bursaphelenchus xylophilus TaxID=6326 RepID=A0A1I7SCL3_BURXY|nr:unnamed protein product [Bursaphelenchus xylophilus]CAG9093903.1 unnamed protein product [Bursaphelenchus xylophilus]